MTQLAARRFGVLFAIAAFAGWVSLRLQFHALGSWSNAADELALAGVAVGVSTFLLLLFIPATLGIERFAPAVLVLPGVLVAATAISFGFGLWVYAGLLPRTLEMATGRDLPYVAAFSIFGAGYFLAYWLQRRLWPPKGGASTVLKSAGSDSVA